jgi:hypothetical protein
MTNVLMMLVAMTGMAGETAHPRAHDLGGFVEKPFYASTGEPASGGPPNHWFRTVARVGSGALVGALTGAASGGLVLVGLEAMSPTPTDAMFPGNLAFSVMVAYGGYLVGAAAGTHLIERLDEPAPGRFAMSFLGSFAGGVAAVGLLFAAEVFGGGRGGLASLSFPVAMLGAIALPPLGAVIVADRWQGRRRR